MGDLIGEGMFPVKEKVHNNHNNRTKNIGIKVVDIKTATNMDQEVTGVMFDYELKISIIIGDILKKAIDDYLSTVKNTEALDSSSILQSKEMVDKWNQMMLLALGSYSTIEKMEEDMGEELGEDYTYNVIKEVLTPFGESVNDILAEIY